VPRVGDQLTTSSLRYQSETVRDGLLAPASSTTPAGRLVAKPCPGPGQNAPSTTRIGNYSGVEAAHLGNFQREGRLDPAILQCGRLAVIARVDSRVTWRVQDYRLLWLDSQVTEGDPAQTGCLHRGLLMATYWGWCSGTSLRAVTGYILDPRLLPATIAGQDAANALDHFVGAGMPATARLIRDAADPPAR
jgi:hypothetical protein